MKRNLISKLKHKILFLKNEETNPLNKSKWIEVNSSFAQIRALHDKNFSYLENMSFGNVMSEEYFLFKIRFTKGIHREMRIKFKERIFEIQRIIDSSVNSRILNIIGLEICL